MASYHRVLKVFDRSIHDKSVECDYDIHPWEVLINGERWAGKIRLIGFVDVFFLMCYSADARFEKGIIIYKDDEAIRDTLKEANVKASDIKLDVVNSKEQKNDPSERVRRAINQHSLLDLLHDAIRLGVISHAEMTAQLLGNFYVGSATDDAMRKYLDTLGSASRPESIALSNEA
ncbi:hypothetical protein F4818DRAFT_21113 [Hypoxylon cercidicola]|nr:hypothetical protein F4818DRAFT_21113 [Hypoxylon cercidicola]